MFSSEDGLDGGEWLSLYGVGGGGVRGVKSRTVDAGIDSVVGLFHLMAP